MTTQPILHGKTVIVTCASRGIGKAAARHLLGLGAHVFLAARSHDRIIALAEEITKAGGAATPIPTDVADSQDVAALVEEAVTQTGRVDLFVNNSGLIDPIARIMDSDPDAWAKVMDVNIKGVYHGLRYAMPVMAAQDEGATIINISSRAANSFLEGWSHYCAPKAAVPRFTGVGHKEAHEKASA